ncbi:DNA glycosylase [Pelagicoccus albus]|uniref:DNA-(apurinic or apyrimidinic site) lyase n=1 Tax=Pelagicoccus albus TaxID=415222 RepID=A0A7X1E717_9BACT|nr:DNA glycosylase [Pelagicoccus albus]MBC2604864.1 DNA-binding protein [Pelagicoccus albus]
MREWTPWKTLDILQPFSEQSLSETLNGGQAFRWNYSKKDEYWLGVWGQNVARLRLTEKDCIQFSHPIDHLGCETELARYLRAKFDWDLAINNLPWRSDPHLEAAISAFTGLRILKQPFGEAVLCFLCSATKQIPQIKVMCERMALRFGNELTAGIHALPTWNQLATASETELRELGLGFRAKNIKKTADILAQHPELLDQIEASPYAEAKQRLVELPGVGEKIADCALLFGAAKLEAFPVDTWIIKVLENRYDLQAWTPSQLAQFGRIHYGAYAGFAQQFVFSYERATAVTQRSKK